MLFVYNLLVLAVLLSLLGMVVMNLFALPRVLKHKLSSSVGVPSVAILVPARNEEVNIEACLRSLLAQDYPDYLVWLYDDASTDSTKEIVTRLAVESSKLHVVPGVVEPPAGWLGKSNACYQLYETMVSQSSPDYVLFTDADVRFAPGALSHAVATAQAQGAGLLSIFPRQITITWAERLAVPILLHWAVYTFLPLPFAFSMRTGEAFAAANGQFMLFSREAYDASGGHSAARSDILEDVALARAVKRSGYKAVLADGGPLVRTRMYDGPSEVWRGYSKNVYAFFGYSPVWLLVGIAALTALYVAPVPLAFYSALATQHPAFVYLPVAQYVVAVLGRLLLAGRFAYRPLDTLLHPIAVVFLIAIAINSMLWSLMGKGAWKGRAASTPRASQG